MIGVRSLIVVACDVFEQAGIRIAPDGGPAYLETLLGKNALDEGYIDAVKVDFIVPQSVLILSPIVPEMLYDLAP